MASRNDKSRSTLSTLAVVVLFCNLVGKSAQACSNGGILMKSGLGPSDKYDILEEHNKLRQSVAQGLIPGQPGAENMLEMQWDDELASKAQEWADQCIFKHDPKKKLGRFTMGQNLALIWSSASLDDDRDSDFPGRIRKWFDEVKKYSFGAKFSLATGHYMQLIWADSFLVGCGYSYHYSGNKYNKLYVCNYGPAGNVQGHLPYVTGHPSCEQHGLQKSHTYPGLCVPGGEVDSYHHDNVIPQNYYSYQASSNNHENQHYTSAPVAYTVAPTSTNHQQPYDNHILYNLVFDQHKQMQQQQQQQYQQYHYQAQHPSHQQTYHHLLNPASVVTATANAAANLLKPGNIFKSPFLSSYRWDMLFNSLH